MSLFFFKVSSHVFCCLFPDAVTFMGPTCTAGRVPVGVGPRCRTSVGLDSGWAKWARPHTFLPNGCFFFICSKKGRQCEATEAATHPHRPGRGEAGRRQRGWPHTECGQKPRKVPGSARLCGIERAQRPWRGEAFSARSPCGLPRRADVGPRHAGKQAPEGARAAPKSGASDIGLVTRHSVSGLLQAFFQSC